MSSVSENLHFPPRPQGIGNNSSTTGTVIKSTSVTIQNSPITTRREIKTCIPHKYVWLNVTVTSIKITSLCGKAHRFPQAFPQKTARFLDKSQCIFMPKGGY